MYQEVSSLRHWNVPANKERPHIDALSLYVRALQRAKVMDDNYQLSETFPDSILKEYQQWARYYYKLFKEEANNDKDDKEDDSFATFKKLTLELFEDTLKDGTMGISDK